MISTSPFDISWLSSQHYKLNIVFFDLLRDLLEILTAHPSSTICNKDNLPLVLELLTICDDHLNGEDDGRNSCERLRTDSNSKKNEALG